MLNWFTYIVLKQQASKYVIWLLFVLPRALLLRECLSPLVFVTSIVWDIQLFIPEVAFSVVKYDMNALFQYFLEQNRSGM